MSPLALKIGRLRKGQEYAKRRKAIGLTQGDITAILGYSLRTENVGRLEAGAKSTFEARLWNALWMAENKTLMESQLDRLKKSRYMKYYEEGK